MSFALIQLLVVGVFYLLMLFAIAYLADRGIIPTRIVRHPVVYILSLGVIAGAWPFFGMVDVAARYGYSYLSYFFGISALFLFGALVLGPMMRISRMYQLRSIPDMLTFRYRSQWAGIVLTIFMLLAMLPLFALQITAVSDTILIITDSSFELFPGDKRQGGLAFAFCCIITLFTVLFGARHVGREERERSRAMRVEDSEVAAFDASDRIGGSNLHDHLDALARRAGDGHRGARGGGG